MSPRMRKLVPLASVESVQRSIGFYAKLGFEVANTFVPEGQEAPAWAWLESDGADLMVGQADEPATPSQPAVLFYLYCEDVAATRAALEESGVPCGPICFPFYAPRGEFRVVDPDGYVLMVTHT